jgi:Protein of unknown function (DUF3302)
MFGFHLDFWDYLTFVSLAIMAIAVVLVIVFLGSLPGRIAIARKHPDAEAVKIMGWAGLLFALPWIQAFGWAFKPTNVVDIRYFPRQEQENIKEETARLLSKTGPTEQPRRANDLPAPPEKRAS